MATRVHASPFGEVPNEGPITQFELSNANGIRVCIMELGAAITRLEVPDRSGAADDIVLGYDTARAYHAGGSYFGAVVGRYANRIAGGRFSLDGESYQLPRNDGANHLHGGRRGFDKRRWIGTPCSDGVVFGLMSAHGDQGYPGTLSARVTYRLDGANRLSVDYTTTTDAPTVVNLTQHSYFNLAGHACGTITDHDLEIAADFFTPVDATLIPTGEVIAVDGTPFDFRSAKPIGREINSPHQQLNYGAGYDHNFVLTSPLDADGLRHAATLFEAGSGRELRVLTDQPGLQFYSGNVLDGSPGKSGAVYARRGGLCLETQRFPNSPNVPHFPSPVLRPGNTLATRTVFEFRVRHAT